MVLSLLLAERGVELLIARRNARVQRERGAVWREGDGLPLIVLAQGVLFGGTLLEGALAPWAGLHPWTWVGIVGLVLAQGLRYWCIATLGWRWSVRVVTVPGEDPVRRGPYRWVSHPNYAVVVAEVVLLPLTFGAYATLLVALPLKLAALRRRVAVEEDALDGSAAGRAPAAVDR